MWFGAWRRKQWQNMVWISEAFFSNDAYHSGDVIKNDYINCKKNDESYFLEFAGLNMLKIQFSDAGKHYHRIYSKYRSNILFFFLFCPQFFIPKSQICPQFSYSKKPNLFFVLVSSTWSSRLGMLGYLSGQGLHVVKYRSCSVPSRWSV